MHIPFNNRSYYIYIDFMYIKHGKVGKISLQSMFFNVK